MRLGVHNAAARAVDLRPRVSAFLPVTAALDVLHPLACSVVTPGWPPASLKVCVLLIARRRPSRNRDFSCLAPMCDGARRSILLSVDDALRSSLPIWVPCGSSSQFKRKTQFVAAIECTRVAAEVNIEPCQRGRNAGQCRCQQVFR